ncbi:Syf2p Ecym_1239 [Eremothecium cymbalariae DBVPG|uniref:Pre-mRNA-splicing factor SYF2 n=1 Tax=Eremothecium cymbalariae (strain CBS 270.75 / DBVPG 7215 / KCTC 17166 / NRRL Y-17582) TaxID=931890 RepID=G8JN21_ERECY|nr:hypothetical protein Ecym_1239 [Eremothecium cymbalariae DBVPG\
MDIDDISSRLRRLKSKRVDISIKNRKEIVSEEVLQVGRSKPEVYSINDEGAAVNEVQSTSNTERRKLLNYSLIDYEKWDEKEKQANFDGTYSGDIAYSTYKNEIKQLRKGGLTKGKITKGRISESGKVAIEDEKELVNKLAQTLEKTSRERFLREKKRLDGHKANTSELGNFVNEKNRHFNEKLSRQFKELGP